MRDGTFLLGVVGFMLGEVFVFGWLCRRRPQGPRFVSLVANLLSGGCLVMALRAALMQGVGLETMFWLGCSLPAHLADVALRFWTQGTKKGDAT